MSSAEEYRRVAWDCLKLAEATSNSQARTSLLNLAQYWVRLAELAERNKKEYGPAKYYGPAWYQAKAREYATRAQSVTDPGRRAELLRFAGMWLSYTAILNVTPTEDGGLEGKGWKWQQGSWKDGCDYDIEGKVVGGVFRSDEQRKNPDTLERDHSMLIVNRQDDVFAKQRHDPTDSDEPKCKRSYANSSTARLFPAKPSPDISDFNQ